MKKMFFLFVYGSFSIYTSGQIIKTVTDRIKNKIETKVNEKIETRVNQEIDKVLDSTSSKTEKLISNITTIIPDTIRKVINNTGELWRGKFLSEGHRITEEILFDVNTAAIDPGSNNLLKEIALLMKENPELKIKIIGLSEPGSDQTDLENSESMANVIKSVLTNQYGIEADRMKVEGKVETETEGKNDTPQNKPGKRKVKFIKI